MSYPADYDLTETRGLTVTDWVALLRERARSSAPSTGYVFLKDGETEYARLSFAELDHRARVIAARLQTLAAAGERALLLYPSCLDFIEAFFGCLYAGIVAVPVPLPSRRQASRLTAVIADAAPALILGLAEANGRLREGLAGRTGLVWVATDTPGSESPESWTPPVLNQDSLAFLQYTSGSTGDPKGVMVSHGNLLANQESIRQAFGHSEHSTVVGWLPLYHDMGLIGNVLQPLYVGSRAILMSPLDFLEKPVRWLRAISGYRAATSGGPNFAYDLCVRKVAEEDKRGLNLDSWSLAFNGSEPVRSATLERFSNAFRPCGFRRESFFPCYGLAEATLFVSGDHLETRGSRPGEGAASDRTPGLPAPVSGPVSCGRTRTGNEVRIVDPETLRPRPEGRTGEIWVAGPSIAQGYRNRPEESESLFRAKLTDTGPEPQGSYLRTGDLGFLEGGRLHVTGRIKDLIILRGRNVHPEDVEQTLTERVAKLQPGGCAAFAIEDGDEETLAVVAELRREAIRLGDFEAVFETIRQVLVEDLDIAAARLVLVPPGAIPKTSSGKLRRKACKQALLDGVLPVLARVDNASEPAAAPSSPNHNADSESLLRQALAGLAPERRTPLITRFLRDRIARLSQTDPARLSDTTPLRSVGLDSLKIVEIKHAVESVLGIDASLSLFLSDGSIQEAAAALSRDEIWPAGAGAGGAVSSIPTGPEAHGSSPPPSGHRLAFPQQAMWTVQQMDPGSIVYNLHLAMRIEGPLDEILLRAAFDRLADRHVLLRTVYRTEGGPVLQSAPPAAEIPEYFSSVDACRWTETELQEDLGRRVSEPFDLARGPVFRAALYRHGVTGGQPAGSHTLLLCAHHIALDLWSLLIFLRELKDLYAALSDHREPGLPVLAADYRDFVAWQADYLNGPAGEAAWEYWRSRLSGELPVLALPVDYPRTATSDCRGASVAIRLRGEESRRLKDAASFHGTTLFTLLLAAYQVLLHRYTHQRDLIVGIPTSGRSRNAFVPVVGNFVNPVPLRTFPGAGQTFSAYLAEVREALLGALEHQDFPFPVMVERLQPERTADHWPLYQTLFVLQQAQAGAEADYASWALGEDSAPSTWGNGSLRSLAIEKRVERFDLKLMAAECGDELLLSFQYRTALFAESSIRNLAEHFRNLLAGIAAAPETRLGEIPLLGDEERIRLLSGGSDPERFERDENCLHRLFEMQAERTPEAPAVTSGGRTLKYRELERLADRWARRLVAEGVVPGDKVGICVERSSDLPLGILATFKAGAAYVPLDPAYPTERIADLLKDAGIRVLLTQTRVWEGRSAPEVVRFAMDIPWNDSTDRLIGTSLPEISADHLAYVIYTSGSTGQPKGVAISHRSLVNYTRSITELIGATGGLHYALVSTPAADLGNTVLFTSLTSGGCLHVLDYDTTTDGRLFADYVARHPIDVLKIVPSHVMALLDSAEDRNILPRQTLICGGDVLPRSLVRRIADLHPGCRVINHYGPTETTVGSLSFPVTTDEVRASVPIGRPLANTRVYLLDANLEPVPVGVPGELHIGGLGLAQGYLNRPDLTAERFIPDPFGAVVGGQWPVASKTTNRSSLTGHWPLTTGHRLYRTGDLARWTHDGVIEFLGRADHQLKIRGFRIEPGEIEARLRAYPGVRAAIVAAFEDPPGTQRLAAYIVAAGTAPEEEALRLHLREALPDYMVPSAFVFLDALPLTSNGKPNRKALPKPDLSAGSHRYDPPETPTETLLANLWAEVLRVDRVGRHDNFFSLGGDSILSIQMASRARQSGWNLSPRELFQHQTIAELATALKPAVASQTMTGGVEAPTGNDGQFPLAVLPAEEVEVLKQKWPDLEDIYPATPMQDGLLFHTLVQPHSGVYLMQHRYWIEGQVEPEVFRQAWQRIVDRHPILRTSFHWDSVARPHQIVHRQVSLPFEFHDWCGWPETDQEARLEALLAAEREEGFDLGVPPLLRIRLFRLGEERYLLIRSHHHILLDAWCTSLILTELAGRYQQLLRQKPAEVETAPAFRDYIGWLQRQDLATAEDFWRHYLRDFSEPTPLGVDRPVTGGEETLREVRDLRTFLSESDTEALINFAKRKQLTLNTLVQAAWALLLRHYSGKREVLFGITVAGRPADLDGVETMLGLFINSLPLRVRIRPEQEILAFLRDLQQQTLEIRQYEYPSLTQIQGWSELPKGDDLFQHLLAFENAPVDPALQRGEGLWRFVDARHRTHTNYPINGVVIPGRRLYLQLSYQAERFDAGVMARMFEHWRHLLLGLVRHPDRRVADLAMLTEAEHHSILLDWNRTDRSHPPPTDIVARFEAQAETVPDAVAAVCGEERLTYGDLNERVNRLAHALVHLGVGPEVIVALLDDRGLDFLTMLLAVFKAGGAYLPLDPAHPDARLTQVLEQSRAGMVLIGNAYRERASALRANFPGRAPAFRSVTDLLYGSDSVANLAPRHGPDSLAFVIFTSGSTGTPKGAMVEHRGMFNNLITKVPTLGLTEADVIAQTAGQCFDISVWQHLTALACGARVEIFPDEVVRDPNLLLRQLAACEVTILEAVPSMIQALLELVGNVELPSLRWLIACGEVFPPELCRRWMERFPHIRVLNAYGPAECSDDVTYYEVQAIPALTETLVPVGYPVDNTRIYLLDPWLNPVPVGVPGEICVGGIQVGRGYLHRPELTAEKFVPNPFGAVASGLFSVAGKKTGHWAPTTDPRPLATADRLYRTGDLGRYREDGTLEFLGRTDHQVKIRGARIEPGEIEAQLLAHPSVDQALVVARADGGIGGKRLVAYLVGKEIPDDESAWMDELRGHLSTRLPNFMMPSAFVRLDAMPLSANGKIDRKRLPAPDLALQREDRYIAPRNPAEEILAGIWQEVLGVERVGVEDSFFDLGGHSLIAVQVLSRIRSAFGIDVPLRQVFEASSIAQLSVVVEECLIEQLEELSEENAAALLQNDA